MKKSLFLGTLVLMSLPLLSRAEEQRNPPPMTQAQLEYLAKVNCDDFTGDAKNYCLEKKRQAAVMQTMLSGSGTGSGTMLPPPPREDRDSKDRPRPPRDGSGTMMPPPRDGSGASMERDGKGLMLAIGQLSPADREALIKMIKDYLVSKGIDPAKYAEKRDEIKDMKKDMRDEAKDMRKATREEIQKKRDEMQAKIKEMRGNGKVNVQDMH
jgi:hypothetical protein